MNAAEPSYRRLFWSLALIGLIVDQASKYIVFHELYQIATPYGAGKKGEVDLIPGAFKLLAQFSGEQDEGRDAFSPLRTWGSDLLPQVNRGALFGIGNGSAGDANTVFAVVSVLAAVAIICWSMRRNTGRERFLCLSLGLILAGTLGNLYDRVVFGGVRDFLYWYLGVDWPVFNIADCCLVCGAGLLLLQAFFTEPHTQALAVPAAADEAALAEAHAFRPDALAERGSAAR
jgi:lipoprotein signal peptidase